MPEENVGYYEKYNVTRKDGKDVSGHEFFVLDLTSDANAIAAAMFYASATKNLELLRDVQVRYEQFLADNS